MRGPLRCTVYRHYGKKHAEDDEIDIADWHAAVGRSQPDSVLAPGYDRRVVKPNHQNQMILLSGDIEAHQSILGFKTVRSRIVELPFNEGQWVKTGTLLSRFDDSDYRQQVMIAQIDAQDAEASTCDGRAELRGAARKLLDSDAADLELAKLEFTRADDLMKRVQAPFKCATRPEPR